MPEPPQGVIQRMATLPDGSRGRAWLSKDERYRYLLARTWDVGAWHQVWIMLNPSTADESTDDATIRRCIGYAKRERFGGIAVLNLCAYRAHNPARLLAADDPIGEHNGAVIGRVLGALPPLGFAPLVVAAWGAHASRNGLREVAEGLVTLMRQRGLPLDCLGTTKDGWPVHPLYQRADATFRLWETP